jgi:hypothetical protein
MGKPLDLLSQLVTAKRFESFNDARMQNTSPLLEQTTVGHLMR